MVRISSVLMVLAFVLSNGVVSAANKPAKPKVPRQQQEATSETIYQFTSRFTVKILNDAASMFDGDRNQSHGSGFLIGVREGEGGKPIGVIFTNNHVTSQNIDQIQQIKVLFNTENDTAEEVVGKVVFRSQILDFAVVEVDLSKLERAQNFITTAQIPPKDSPLYQFAKQHRKVQGRPVIARGNPFDSTDVATPGIISSRFIKISTGPWIQTTAAINPGNSGGPLVDVETGVVVGMNTEKLTEADTTGFAIPIASLIEEYEAWLQDPTYANSKGPRVRYGANPKAELEVRGIAQIITKKYPKFFLESGDDVLRVHDAHPSSGLKTDDQVLKVAGRLLSGSLFELRKEIQKSKGSVPLEIVRDGKIINVELQVVNEGYSDLKREVNFVFLSGMIFRDLRESALWWIDRGFTSRVLMTDFLESIEANFGASRMPAMNSLLVGVNIEGHDYPIENLFDLKIALNRHPKAKFLRMDVKEPVFLHTQNGMRPVVDDFGYFKYEASTATFFVPITRVVTPTQFSVHRFQKQFSFEQGKPETRDWNKFVDETKRAKYSACEAPLKKEPGN